MWFRYWNSLFLLLPFRWPWASGAPEMGGNKQLKKHIYFTKSQRSFVPVPEHMSFPKAYSMGVILHFSIIGKFSLANFKTWISVPCNMQVPHI